MTSLIQDDGVTASAVGLSRKEQIPIVLHAIVSQGGVAKMHHIYSAIEENVGQKLSKQGRASLREVINRFMVNKKYIAKGHGGWAITERGRLKLQEDPFAARLKIASPPSNSPVDIETFEGTVEDVDLLIKEQRLRIGRVDTGDNLAVLRRRLGQQRLRELTLVNYASTCALCDVKDPSLLVASHIVGWAEDTETRGLLANIMCLCGFHDILFEKGYLSFADNLVVLKRSGQVSRTIGILLDNTIEFQKPTEHPPNPEFLRRHRLKYGY